MELYSLSQISKKEKLFYVILTLIFIVLYAFYLPQDIMDIDSTQYAEITREMVENHDYFKIRDNGRKYLDKPIMTFWILSFSFNIFGANNFAYRFPALLMAVISLIGIFKLAYLLYQKERKAWFAMLFYLSSPALFTMLTSPIIDIYLTTFVIFVFLFYYYGLLKNDRYFYLMYLFIGIGFITKGPISLALPLLAIGGNIIITRNFDILKRMHLLYGIIIISIPILFWSYLLYKDFGIFGPYFFLYLQSFGRFFSKIYDTGWNPFYFYYTFIYSILPFSLPFIIILFYKLKEIKKQYSNAENIKTKIINIYNDLYKKDVVLYLWVFFILILLSFSKFRLPQYIFWLVPGACIVAGNWLEEYLSKKNKTIINSFYFIPTFLFILLLYLPFYTGEQFTFLFYIYLFLILLILFFFYKTFDYSLIYTFFAFLLFYCYIISSLYPMLIKYQPASKIAQIIFKLELEKNRNNNKILYTYGIPFSHRSYAFYTKRITRPYSLKKAQFINELKVEKHKFIVVQEIFFKSFENELFQYFGKDLKINILGKFPYYKVSKPSLYFFNNNKREKMLKYVYLVEVLLN
ncbi:MAG: dolichyl-phosphate-mannose--protein mannosyltransferase [Leptospiraceae bacterium]|nr:MAG: dolichyl-phosphate-mannose--protein mannosyltransferase [Leptospiraceae bacterium]